MISSSIQTWTQFKEKLFGITLDKFEPICKQFNLPETTQIQRIALLRQFVSNVANVLEKFLEDQDKLSIMFFPFVKDQLKDSVLELLAEQKFSSLIYEYDNFFIGNQKQLIVYKKNSAELLQYLSKYKPNTAYSDVKRDIDDIVESLIRNNKQMNVKFSLDQDYKGSQKLYNDDLKKLQKVKKKFMKLLNQLFDHFAGQAGRYKFTMKPISGVYKDEIRKLAEEKQLYFNEIFLAETNYQIDITKPGGRGLDRDNDRKQSKSNQQCTQNQVKEHENQQKREITNQDNSPTLEVVKNEENLLKQKQFVEVKEQPNQKNVAVKNIKEAKNQKEHEPPKISSFKLLATQCGQVKLSFEASASNNSPIKHFNIYIIESNKLSLIQKIPYIDNQNLYELILEGNGHTIFTIKAENSIGQSLRYQSFEIIIPSRPNYKMIMRGQSKFRMIPGLQDEEDVATGIEISMNCSDVEVSNCVMIRDSRGNVASWGRVYSDQTKDQVILDPISPFQVGIKHVNKISCAAQFYLCCDVLGNVYGFGKNRLSELGIPKLKGTETLDPVLIPYFKSKQIFITDVACKGNHSLALDSKGSVYCWGANEIGGFGSPIYDSFNSIKNFTSVRNEIIRQNLPRQIEQKAFGSRRVIKIAIGQTFASVINEDKELYTWGSNDYGQLGLGKIIVDHVQYQNILSPAIVPTFNKDLQLIDISLGFGHSLALCLITQTKQQCIYSWGDSTDGACGHQEEKIFYQPQRIMFFKDHKIEWMRACYNGSFVKTDKGLYEFGVQQKDFEDRIEKLNYQWASSVVDVSSNSSVDAFLVEMPKQQ